MTTQTLVKALKAKKPAVIRERGAPRFVVLDWDTYRAWEEVREDMEDSRRLLEALADPKNQRRTPYARVKKLLNLT